MKPYQKIFDRIREAVLPEFRERVADYLVEYETVLLDSNADAAKGSASSHLSIMRLSHIVNHGGNIGRKAAPQLIRSRRLPHQHTEAV